MYKGKRRQFFMRNENGHYIWLYIEEAAQHKTQKLIKEGWKQFTI